MLRLVIGNKNYSSWSLRAWLYLRESHIDFEEIRIPLFSDSDWRGEIRQFSPAGRVPVLLDGDIAIWDSLAIFEYLRERYTSAVGWPEDPVARARAWSITAEMHSGFIALRDELPQNLRARRPRDLADLSDTCQAQVHRVQEIWQTARSAFGRDGSWLFGEFSTADVMFAPVALRFVTYDIPVTSEAQWFVERVQALPAVRDWIAAAEREDERLPFIDQLLPASDAPLTLG